MNTAKFFAPLSVTAAIFMSTALPSNAIIIETTDDALALANQLFLGQESISVTGATLVYGVESEFGFGEEGPFPPEFDGVPILLNEIEEPDGDFDGPPIPGVDAFQSGTYTNDAGTFGLPSPGIALSTGDVSFYGTGENAFEDLTTSFNMMASEEQQDILTAISGQEDHFDPVELEIMFDVAAGIEQVSFIGVFGSEEFPEYVNDGVNDGFGIFINGVNVAGALETGAAPGDTPLPINIDHPDMADIAGTELDGILAPNGIPLLRFDVPVVEGENSMRVILADAGDTAVDTTVYLSSVGDFDSVDGTSEFTPLLPSNPPDENGTFVIEIEAPELGTTIWFDPPVSVGFTYDIDGATIDSITAPSLLTVNDPDGYVVTVAGVDYTILPGQTLDFATPFSDFIVTGISEDLMLQPGDPLAFPIGWSFASAGGLVTVGITPITVDVNGNPPVNPVPLPGAAWLLLAGLGGLSVASRKKKAA